MPRFAQGLPYDLGMTIQTGDTGGFIPEWTWGDRLRKARRHAGMTQAEFAEWLDVHQKAYSAWEADVNEPRAATMRAIAGRIQMWYGIPAAWIMGVEMQNAPRPDGPGGVDDLRARRDSNPKPSEPKVMGLLTWSAAA